MAEEFLRLVKGEFEETVVAKDGNVVTYKRRASAAEFAVIRAFLKDNNITGIPTDDNALGRLKQALASKQHGKGLPVDPRLDLPQPESPLQ
jgi:hypothetical protein